MPNLPIAVLGGNASMLGRWCREAACEGNRAFRGQGVSREVEVTALKRELARVKKERDFNALEPETKWVTDLTEFKTGEGKLY